MPTPPRQRIRYTLMAIGALGLIGTGTAAIVVGSASEDREIRLTATAPDAAPVETEGTSTITSPSTQPAATQSASPSASVSASASPSASASAPATVRAKARPNAAKPRTKSPAPAKTTQTTQTPSGGNEGSTTVAAEVIRLVNAEREKSGCSGLTSESRLEAAAQKHSELQAAQNTMSHQLPGEAGMGERVTAEGYRWRAVAENVAAGYTTAASVMDGWMNSPGHKANILNCVYEEIGVGLAKSSSGTLYWTQNFATPA